MKLTISGENKKELEENVKRFMNVATLVCLKGELPLLYDIDHAETVGRWWCKDVPIERYSILGIANNIWVNIVHDDVEDRANFMQVEFWFRYDKDDAKKKAISTVMLAFFDFVSN